MPTTTTNYGLLKPLVNNATDQDLWGGYLNDDMDDIDAVLLTAMNFIPTTKTASFSVTAPTAGSTTTGNNKALFRCNSTSGAIVASLPAAATATNMTIAFKRTNAAGNAITVQANGAETIDGSNTLSLSAQYDAAILVCNGTTWNNLTANTSGLAPLASPTFTGVPAAPTAAAATSTTQIATTAFVQNAIAASTIKALVSFTCATGTILKQSNVASVTRNSTGRYTINFTTPMADANYIVQTTIGNSSVISGSNGTYAIASPITAKLTTSVDILTVLAGNVADPTQLYITVLA